MACPDRTRGRRESVAHRVAHLELVERLSDRTVSQMGHGCEHVHGVNLLAAVGVHLPPNLVHHHRHSILVKLIVRQGDQLADTGIEALGRSELHAVRARPARIAAQPPECLLIADALPWGRVARPAVRCGWDGPARLLLSCDATLST